MKWMTSIIIDEPPVEGLRIKCRFCRSLAVNEPAAAPEASRGYPLGLTHPTGEQCQSLAVS